MDSAFEYSEILQNIADLVYKHSELKSETSLLNFPSYEDLVQDFFTLAELAKEIAIISNVKVDMPPREILKRARLKRENYLLKEELKKFRVVEESPEEAAKILSVVLKLDTKEVLRYENARLREKYDTLERECEELAQKFYEGEEMIKKVKEKNHRLKEIVGALRVENSDLLLSYNIVWNKYEELKEIENSEIEEMEINEVDFSFGNEINYEFNHEIERETGEVYLLDILVNKEFDVRISLIYSELDSYVYLSLIEKPETKEFEKEWNSICKIIKEYPKMLVLKEKLVNKEIEERIEGYYEEEDKESLDTYLLDLLVGNQNEFCIALIYTQGWVSASVVNEEELVESHKLTQKTLYSNFSETENLYIEKITTMEEEQFEISENNHIAKEKVEEKEVELDLEEIWYQERPNIENLFLLDILIGNYNEFSIGIFFSEEGIIFATSLDMSELKYLYKSVYEQKFSRETQTVSFEEHQTPEFLCEISQELSILREKEEISLFISDEIINPEYHIEKHTIKPQNSENIHFTKEVTSFSIGIQLDELKSIEKGTQTEEGEMKTTQIEYQNSNEIVKSKISIYEPSKNSIITLHPIISESPDLPIKNPLFTTSEISNTQITQTEPIFLVHSYQNTEKPKLKTFSTQWTNIYPHKNSKPAKALTSSLTQTPNPIFSIKSFENFAILKQNQFLSISSYSIFYRNKKILLQTVNEPSILIEKSHKSNKIFTLSSYPIFHSSKLLEIETTYENSILISEKQRNSFNKSNSLRMPPKKVVYVFETVNNAEVEVKPKLKIQPFLEIDRRRNINIDSQYFFYTDDEEIKSGVSTPTSATRRPRRVPKRKPAVEEYFTLSFEAVRLNLSDPDQLPYISPDDMYKKAVELEIPFNKWHDWLHSQFELLLSASS